MGTVCTTSDKNAAVPQMKAKKITSKKGYTANNPVNKCANPCQLNENKSKPQCKVCGSPMELPKIKKNTDDLNIKPWTAFSFSSGQVALTEDQKKEGVVALFDSVTKNICNTTASKASYAFLDFWNQEDYKCMCDCRVSEHKTKFKILADFRSHLLSHANLREVHVHYNGPSTQRVTKEKAMDSGMWCTDVPGEFITIEDILQQADG